MKIKNIFLVLALAGLSMNVAKTQENSSSQVKESQGYNTISDSIQVQEQDLENEMLKAISSRNSERMQELKKMGVKMDTPKIRTFLMLLVHKAAFAENLEETYRRLSSIEFYVQQGGDINITLYSYTTEELTITDSLLTYICSVGEKCPESLLVTMRKLIALGIDIKKERVTTYLSGPIYEDPMELNRYNHATKCYNKINDILKNASIVVEKK